MQVDWSQPVGLWASCVGTADQLFLGWGASLPDLSTLPRTITHHVVSWEFPGTSALWVRMLFLVLPTTPQVIDPGAPVW